MPWFPGDPGPEATTGGVEDRSLAIAPRFTRRPPPGADTGQLRNRDLIDVRDVRLLQGAYFPPAVQPIGPCTGLFFGDAGDGEHPINEGGRGAIARYPQDAGRDWPADTPARGQGFVQWSPPLWGMDDSATEYRTRFLVALDEPSAAGRPQFAPRSLAMRPSATALHPRVFGEPSGVATRRTVAPGRVTRWNQPSLVFPEFGPGG
jgi:hypothetical protein